MQNKLLKTSEELAAGENFAVGNDLVFIPGFEKSFTPVFKNKVYTAGEIAYCNQFDNASLRYASTWAAKEAVYKALKQLDPASVSWKKLEIVRDKIAGRPRVVLHQNAGTFQISLSISHDGDYVWAVAFIKIICKP